MNLYPDYQFPGEKSISFDNLWKILEKINDIYRQHGRELIAELLDKSREENVPLSALAEEVFSAYELLELKELNSDLKAALPYIITLVGKELYFYVPNAGKAYQQVVQDIVDTLTSEEIGRFMTGIKLGYPLHKQAGFEKILELCTDGQPQPSLKMSIMTKFLSQVEQ